MLAAGVLPSSPCPHPDPELLFLTFPPHAIKMLGPVVAQEMNDLELFFGLLTFRLLSSKVLKGNYSPQLVDSGQGTGKQRKRGHCYFLNSPLCGDTWGFLRAERRRGLQGPAARAAALAPASAGSGAGARRGRPRGPAELGLREATLWPAPARWSPRGRPGPRGPVARGRAGRRRRAPSCAARLVAAILDAAAAAASASSSVFAARCWFLRPERRGGETGGCRRKRKKGVESVGDRAGGWRTDTERGGEEKAPRPSPSPAAADPPRQRLCSQTGARPPSRPCRGLAAPEGALPRPCLPLHARPASQRPGHPPAPPPRGRAAAPGSPPPPRAVAAASSAAGPGASAATTWRL